MHTRTKYCLIRYGTLRILGLGFESYVVPLPKK